MDDDLNKREYGFLNVLITDPESYRLTSRAQRKKKIEVARRRDFKRGVGKVLIRRVYLQSFVSMLQNDDDDPTHF